jgi:choline dehydrogenase-like flavoprotein
MWSFYRRGDQDSWLCSVSLLHPGGREETKSPSLTEAFVEKILTKNADGSIIAIDVRVRMDEGAHHKLVAKKEVILSVGAIQSLQILELSGIGQKELLEKHGISVVLDSPGVGENLQDHAISAPCFEIADDQISADIMRDPNIVQAVLQQYMITKTGPLIGIPASVAMLPLIYSNGRLSSDDIARLILQYVDDTNLHLWQRGNMSSSTTRFLGLKREPDA